MGRRKVDRKRLLELIVAHPGISGTELADHFEVSRMAICMGVRKLRHEGHPITSSRNGYFPTPAAPTKENLACWNINTGKVIESVRTLSTIQEPMLQQIRSSVEWAQLSRVERRRLRAVLTASLAALRSMDASEMVKIYLAEDEETGRLAVSTSEAD